MMGDSLVRQVKRIPPIVWLAAAFVALAIFYSLIIPIFEGPDEDDHFRYAQFIADHRALPVQLFEPGGGEAGHQGWQPPLYYSLAAILSAPIDTSDFSQHLWRNEHVTFVGDPACCGRNIYYHTDSENFPFTGTTLAVHLARVLSIAFSLVTIIATYTLAKIFFPDQEGLSLATAAVVAFNPSFLFASVLISNDAPLAAFSSLVLLILVKLLQGQWTLSLKSSAWLGTLNGLTVLTKTTALGLLPLSMCVLVVVAWRRRNLPAAILGNLMTLTTFVLISGWWFARNQWLYGDPLALRLVSASALFPRSGPLTLPELFQISLPQMWQTFWGGPTPSDFSPALLALLAASTVLAAIGMIIFILRHSSPDTRLSLAYLAAWLGLILVLQIQFIRVTTGADQGRYLFPALPVVGLFFVLGLVTLVRQMTKDEGRKDFIVHLSSSVIGLGFFVLALFVPLAYTLPAYARPALLSQNDLPQLAHPLQINFADQMELRGFDLDKRSFKPGETARITLYWRALAPMAESYRVFVHLIGLNDRRAGGVDVIPARGAFPTVYWKPGDVLRDAVQFPVAANAMPGKYSIEVGLYPVGKPGERLAVVGSNDDRAVMDWVKISPGSGGVTPPLPTPQTRVSANFAERVQLIGYDSRTDSNSFHLTLYWQALAPMDRDYTVFVHLLRDDGKILTQADHQPQESSYPTSIWDAGDNVRDDFTLPFPRDAAPGRYKIKIGWYDAKTGERLPALDAANRITGDSIILDNALEIAR